MTRVLIVDDHEQNLYMLQVLLQGQGYEVRSARNGIEALEQARREVPDLIITDILMPGMDGFSLCREWMADERLRHVPLAFYTATYTDPQDEAFALSLGAARFIVKPTEPDAFAEILRQVLENHAAQRLVPPGGPSQAAEVYYQQYNQALIRKLEDKMAQLEAANRALELDIAKRKRAEAALEEYSERLEDMVAERTRELQTAQEQLVRRERLVVLGQLAGGVSHELRNPLGAIKNAVYFLGLALETPDPDVKETLGVINTEIETSERIINSLLDFARARAPARQPVDVNCLVQAELDRIKIPAAIEVVCELAPDMVSLADVDQLKQIFGNLLLNAVQAMSPLHAEGTGGRLTVGTKREGEWLVASCADTGVGVPPENLGKLFEPLFTTKARGIGLGLAVSKKLLEANGGRIEVQSESGKGSIFTIYLPIYQEGTK
jgi:signal transduction histidine kinase/CheY-like chemotaxis protein